MDRVDEWRLFAAVATQRSFAKAASAQGRSPQATTRAIAALEERLGTRLLNRTTRSVSLTDAGARCLEQARRVLADFDQLEAREEAAPSGNLAVTAPVLFGQLHLAPIVAAFLEAQPRINVRLLLLDRAVSLTEEGVDVAVRIGELPDSALKARTVGRVRPVLCASPAYLEQHGAPRRPKELARHSCVAFTATTPIPERWTFARPGERERAVGVHPRLIVNTGQAAIDAAVAGLGVVRVLSYQVAALVAAGKLRVLLPGFQPEPLPVHVLQPPGAPVRAASLFADFASERLRAVLQKQDGP